jgi:hypothetical protein
MSIPLYPMLLSIFDISLRLIIHLVTNNSDLYVSLIRNRDVKFSKATPALEKPEGQ